MRRSVLGIVVTLRHNVEECSWHSCRYFKAQYGGMFLLICSGVYLSVACLVCWLVAYLGLRFLLICFDVSLFVGCLVAVLVVVAVVVVCCCCCSCCSCCSCSCCCYNYYLTCVLILLLLLYCLLLLLLLLLLIGCYCCCFVLLCITWLSLFDYCFVFVGALSLRYSLLLSLLNSQRKTASSTCFKSPTETDILATNGKLPFHVQREIK